MAVFTKHVESCDLEPWKDLSGKIVMVTGASAGIGWDLCINLAKCGCRIIATARRIERLTTLCDEINTFNTKDGKTNQNEARNGDVRAVAVELDVSSNGPTIEAADAFGHIDVLVNNAGIIGPVQSVLDLSEDDWDRIFRTNATGSWLVAKYVCLQMRAVDQRGSIINISSVAGLDRILPPGVGLMLLQNQPLTP